MELASFNLENIFGRVHALNQHHSIVERTMETLYAFSLRGRGVF